MNKKNQTPSLNGGVHSNKIPYNLNQLPYEPIISLAVDKSTQSTIGFSIQETQIATNVQTNTRQLKATSINYVRNAIARHFSGNPGDLSIDSSPELSSASFAKAMKEQALQPKLAKDNRLVRTAQIERILTDIFATLSQSFHGNPRPSPKNPTFGEVWSQRGRRFPQN